MPPKCSPTRRAARWRRARSQDDAPLAHTRRALHGSVAQRRADAVAAPVGRHRDQQLAAGVDAGDSDNASAFHRRQRDAVASPQCFHQRTERLGVLRRRRSEVPRLVVQFVEESIEFVVERRVQRVDHMDVVAVLSSPCRPCWARFVTCVHRDRVRSMNTRHERDQRMLSATYPDAAPVAGHHELIQLQLAGAEAAGGGEQVEVPHAPEALVVRVGQLVPAGVDVRLPRHQRAVVVRTEVLEILDHQAPLGSVCHLRHRGQHRVGEDVLLHPRVGLVARAQAADRVQQREAVGVA